MYDYCILTKHMENIKTENKINIKEIIKSIFWILLLSLSGLGLMMLISPEAKVLPVFLIGFFVIVVIIVLVALYINYAVNIYKQITKH